MLHSDGLITLSKVHHLTSDQDARFYVREWIQQILSDRRWSPINLAKEAGVSPTTIYRAIDPDAAFTPTYKTVEKIANKTGYPLPGRAYGNAPKRDEGPLRADHIVPYRQKGLEKLDHWDNGLWLPAELDTAMVYRVLDRALELEGYLPGDVVIVDENRSPRAGDIVCAAIASAKQDASQDVLRLFEPPYLMSRSIDRTLEPVPILVDRTVEIKGTVTRMFRELRAS